MIYVVDDNSDVTRTIAVLLELFGLRVACFTSAVRCLDESLRRPPSCIVLDLSMPIMDGPALLAGLQAAGVKAPVVVITGAPYSKLAAAARAAGVQHILAKPVRAELLLAAITAATAGTVQPARN